MGRDRCFIVIRIGKVILRGICDVFFYILVEVFVLLYLIEEYNMEIRVWILSLVDMDRGFSCVVMDRRLVYFEF